MERTLDLEEVLSELGLEVASEDDAQLYCRCPFHDDERPSFAISRGSGLWICYTGCGEGNLVGLVAQVQGSDWAAARRWLQHRSSAFGSEAAVLELIEPAEESAAVERPLYFYERGQTYKYMLDRGFTAATLKKWDVGRDGQLRAVAIPYRPEGELLGLVYRFIDPGVEPKYDNTGRLPKSQHLFGWEHLPAAPDEVVVAEGPLDVLWLDQHGYAAVGILGSRLSAKQADLLVHRTGQVVLALDADEPGRRGTKRAIEQLGSRLRRTRVVRWPPGTKDAPDCGVSALSDAIQGAEDGVLWLVRQGTIDRNG